MKKILIILLFLSNISQAAIREDCQKEIEDFCKYSEKKDECLFDKPVLDSGRCDKTLTKILYENLKKECLEDVKNLCYDGSSFIDFDYCIMGDKGGFTSKCLSTYKIIKKRNRKQLDY